MKYQPKKFWNMLKQKNTEDIAIKIEDFTYYNKTLFHDEDLIPDHYTPLTTPEDHLISPEELTAILEKKYKAMKSRGLSTLPP